ncbi:radical SAM protein [Methanococcoides sp. NM1]|uniref:radical SAM protein n=1 Tax=Methanococcoides sp. NM1 TaxID=1201013 RepID=UPI001AEF3BB8|nr:radical SAM protein [Methanococcoides sp. NM1]
MRPETKAELIAVGSLDIEPSLLGKVTVPTAGPGAGKTAFFFHSGNQRVRLALNKDSPLKAVADGDDIVIMRDGKEIARGEIEEELIHCPDQAYINMTERCIFDCKFCPVPKLNGKVKTIEEVVDLIGEANATGKMKAISITSGVDESVEKELERALEVVHAVKKYGIPIGVAVYPTPDSNILLKKAGVDEIKYNVETMDRELYKKVCPGQDMEEILQALKGAVEVFGKNKVCANFIIGLGETDETVEKGIRELISIGVVPILRPASMHPLREGEVFIERPSKERLLKLTRLLRKILDENGLRADVFKTMCLPCTGCDMNPHTDLCEDED